jgi:rubrerythrin
MQRCEHCQHDATLLDDVSEVARVDYYRCPVCGEVWTFPKRVTETTWTQHDERRGPCCPLCGIPARPFSLAFANGLQTLTYLCKSCGNPWETSTPEEQTRWEPIMARR